MIVPFDPGGGLITVQARLWGPTGDVVVRLALDTGATRTVINRSVLVVIGYDPAAAPEKVQITTGSGIESALVLTLERIEALGREQANLSILCHTLPPSAIVDGLLGLDFLRDQRLTLDFRTGKITLE